ncbi:PolC-type DNA polymerase III [Lachnotalea glycerini]|uniref:3'-5' exonuclease n=1 Tax=Lachnotalea glycerini TaxID=1763509 RepID=UPI0015F284BD|nr:3'-5' exonuclease [Lachnotalea glycerini]
MIDSYVALDLETTGLNPKYARILEVGAVKIKKGKVIGTYDKIVNAKTYLSQQIVDLTGITEDMMQSGEDIENVIVELIDFCEDDILLGHNIQFDYSFVKKAAANHKMGFEKEAIDTLKLARKFLPELEKRSLEYLCEYYKIEHVNKHRAYYDALAASDLYKILSEQFYKGNEDAFNPFSLSYQVKREGPITPKQKLYLRDLIKYHNIAIAVQIDSLTKNEASRMIDGIILKHGRIF